ncbi:hypothetical protein LCGC14_0432520 [marine sediment metagenome]|uniref:Uncharacterized protein n=1 Tax=marine sediment metagenome TaxID=412755 RepID=A0A0F9VWX1_9ZZZZ
MSSEDLKELDEKLIEMNRDIIRLTDTIINSIEPRLERLERNVQPAISYMS